MRESGAARGSRCESLIDFSIIWISTWTPLPDGDRLAAEAWQGSWAGAWPSRVPPCHCSAVKSQQFWFICVSTWALKTVIGLSVTQPEPAWAEILEARALESRSNCGLYFKPVACLWFNGATKERLKQWLSCGPALEGRIGHCWGLSTCIDQFSCWPASHSVAIGRNRTGPAVQALPDKEL